MNLKISLFLLLILVACKAPKTTFETKNRINEPPEEEVTEDYEFIQRKKSLQIKRDSAKNDKNEIRVETDYKNWATTQCGEFIFKIPYAYQISNFKDSLVLKKGIDRIIIKSDWLLHWELMPKFIEQQAKVNPQKVNKLYTKDNENNIIFLANYYVMKKNENNLIYQIGYPIRENSGFTEVLIQNEKNQESIKIYGETLSINAIKDVIGIYQSIEYQSVKQVFIESINRQNCDEGLTKEQLEEYISNQKKYGVPHQIESFEKISPTKAKAKLKIYNNCCEDFSFKIEVENKKIQLYFKRNNPILYSYDPEDGLMIEHSMCLCLCLHCYELTIEGIDNPNDYQFYYEGKKLEMKSK